MHVEVILTRLAWIAALFVGAMASSALGYVEVGTHYPAKIATPTDYAGVAAPGEVESRWFHILTHPGATYIAVHFADFDLGPGDYLVISDGTGADTYTMTGRGKMNAGTFWARHVKGDTMILELVVASAEGGRGFRIDQYAAGDVDIGAGDPDPTTSVCGADDRLNAVCFADTHPTEYQRGRAGVRLLINGFAYCSGSLVSPYNLVLTNNHCISSNGKALDTDFELMAEAPDCEGDNCSGCYPGEIFSGGTLLSTDGALDYALIQLHEGDPAATYGYLEIDNRPPVVGEQIYIPQHPGGRAREIALHSSHPADTDGLAHVQSVTLSPCIGGTHQEVGYYAESEPGASGSPVLAASSHKLIALHHCGGCPNKAVPINLIYPLIDAHVLGFTQPGRIAPGAIAVSADSVLGGDAADRTIDADPHTRWTSGTTTGDHWLQIDLGMLAPVIGFKVWHAGADGASSSLNTRIFRIESATQATGPWTTEFVGDNTSGDDVNTFSYAGPQLLRHLRLYITDAGSDGRARIVEFEVIADEVLADTMPIGANVAPQSASAQASSVYGAGYGPDKAIDSVVSDVSKWTSADVNPPHTLTLDLGSWVPVTGFILRQPSAAGEASHYNALDFSFQSARSMSGPWYTEARVLTAGTSDSESRRFTSPKDLRYVRLHLDDPGIDRYARVPEFEVLRFDGSAALFDALPVSGHAPLSVQFSDHSSGEIDAWSWTFGDGDTSEEQHPQHVYTWPGWYTVSLTVDGPGGPDTLTQIDYIHVLSVAPDFDEDGDVDQQDFAHAQLCLTGNGVPVTDPTCLDADLDDDNDVDGVDVERFSACMSGAGLLAQPDCDDG